MLWMNISFCGAKIMQTDWIWNDKQKNNHRNTWQDFFEKMKNFLKNLLMFWWKLLDEFINSPWHIRKIILVRFPSFQERTLDFNLLEIKKRFGNWCHSCHPFVSCSFLMYLGWQQSVFSFVISCHQGIFRWQEIHQFFALLSPIFNCKSIA